MVEGLQEKEGSNEVGGATPAARRQFRIDERRRLQSLDVEKKLALQGMGKLLVTSPKELMIAKPDPRGVAGASNTSRTIGRGRGRGREKVEVNDDSDWLSLHSQ